MSPRARVPFALWLVRPWLYTLVGGVIIKLRIELFSDRMILFVLSLQNHMKKCPFGYVACPNNCNLEVLRSDLDKHLKEECIKRIETCKYCSLKVVSKDMEVNSFICIDAVSVDI